MQSSRHKIHPFPSAAICVPSRRVEIIPSRCIIFSREHRFLSDYMRAFDRIFARLILRFSKFGASTFYRDRGTLIIIIITAAARAQGLQRALILFHIRDYCIHYFIFTRFYHVHRSLAALMRITVHSTFITAIYFLIYLIHLRFQSRIILFPQSLFHFSRFGHRQSFISALYLLSYFIPAIYFNKLPRYKATKIYSDIIC